MPVKYDSLGNVSGENPPYPVPNQATTIVVNGYIKEKDPPRVVFAGDTSSIGGPSNVPQIATGDIRRTSIEYANKNREHVCDFVGELEKNIYLKKFIRWAANAIRDGIRALIRALGISDRSGLFTEITNRLKSLARELNHIRKTYIEPVIEFQKYVLAYIVKIRAIIQYILSLPARLLQAVKECLARLLRLIGSIFSDFLTELGPIGGTEGIGSDVKDLISAGRELLGEVGGAINDLSTVAALTVAIPVAATAGLLIPTTQEELDAATQFIDTYESNNPTAAAIAEAGGFSNLKQFGFPDSSTNLNNSINSNRFALP